MVVGVFPTTALAPPRGVSPRVSLRNGRSLGLYGASAFLVALLAGCAEEVPQDPTPSGPPEPDPPGQVEPVGYFVTPDGTSGGDGSITSPWSYEHAFGGAGGAIQPGDTVWFRAGTYAVPDQRSVTVSGSGETRRVVFRAYPGERAVFAATRAAEVTWIDVEGSWLTLWGLEFTNTSPDRLQHRGWSVYNDGNCNRFLNVVVRDGGIGLFLDPARYGVEVIGSIFYNNGSRSKTTPMRGEGHGIYAKSNAAPANACRPGQARLIVRDNVAFNQFGYGIHAYTDLSEGLSGVLIEGNVVFNNGASADVAYSDKSSNLLLGGDAQVVVVSHDTVRWNMSYYSPATKLENPGDGIRIGYVPGPWSPRHDHAVVTDNYSVGGRNALWVQNWDTIVVERNVTAGSSVVRLGDASLAHYTWSGNTHYRDPNSTAWYFNAPPAPEGPGMTWQQWRDATGLGGSDEVAGHEPTSPKVFVRSLAPYVPGRGHIIIYNWGLAGSVPVDLSGVLATGDRYAVWNVQDLFADTAVINDVYNGGTVNIPMTGVTPPPPLGGQRMPPRTAPEFDVFVVQKQP